MKILQPTAALLSLVGLASAFEYESTPCYKPTFPSGLPPSNQLYRHPWYDHRCLSRWGFTGVPAAQIEKWNPAPPITCELATGIPGLMLPSKVRFLYSSDFMTLYGPDRILEIATFVSETYATVLAKYDALGIDTGPYIDFLLTLASDSGSVLETGRDGCACVTFAGEAFWKFAVSEKEDDKFAAQQSIAHEAYHCAQFYAHPDSHSGWVLDGSADYFSNVVYPAGDYEWRRDNNPEKMYSPLSPIYDDGERRYAANMFFQAMEMKGGPAKVHEFNMAPPPETTDPLAERARLSRYPGFADDFFYFAKLYTIVTPRHSSQTGPDVKVQTRIEDTCAATGVCRNGNFRRILDHPDMQPTPLTGGSPYLLQANAFTVRHFTTALDASLVGKTISITSNGAGNQRLAFRLATENTWTDMPGTLSTPCPVEGAPPTEILFLYTSTDNRDAQEVEVTLAHVAGMKRRDGETCTPPAQPVNTTAHCGAATGPLDLCLASKTWVLDNASQEAFLNAISATAGGGVQVWGRQTFTADAEAGRWAMAYQPAGLVIYSELLGLRIASNSTTEGQHAGGIVMKGAGRVCMVTTEGGGTVRTKIEVNGRPEPETVAPVDAGTPTGTEVGYRCDAQTLVFVYSRGSTVYEIVYR
ncbi:hypothetical protein B0T18DRAFT_420247 [Schizothecium vesticola]|uniref:Uncharacterized protein n=1 Tax=Schizothecium vesticola TaxID=314040 RepID=A0AA40K0V3_9PEZI|nr:hypothetical protein B0T18DRAFT_420247 [Schizothecium vesticola]